MIHGHAVIDSAANGRGPSMSIMVTGQDLTNAVKDGTFIQGVTKLQGELGAIRQEFSEQQTWYSRFRESLDKHNEQIGRLSGDLALEVEARKSGFNSIERSLAWLKGAAWVLVGIAGVAVAIFYLWLQKYIR